MGAKMTVQNNSSGLGYEVLQEGALVGSGLLTAVCLQSPLGMVGGAVVGGLMYLNAKPVEWISDKIFKDTAAARITAYALSLFATTAINYFVVNATCYSLGFLQVFTLSALTLAGAAALLALIVIVKWAVEKIIAKAKPPVPENQGV